MNILVTGAKGFIGSCLTTILQIEGHNVIALDDLSRGLNNIESVTNNVKFVAHDCREGIIPILDEFDLTKLFETATEDKLDAVVHLAAGTGSLSRPYSELCELNIDMTKKIYQEAVERGVNTFVFPTTSLVEGVPDAPYVKSKQDAMDWLCAQNDDINVIPLQFYNVTGALGNFTEHRKMEVHIIPIMLEQYMKNEPFIVNGDDYDTVDGTPGRDFTNVYDVCSSIINLLEIQQIQPFKVTKPIKLGTGKITTTKEMLDIFNDYMFPKFKRPVEYKVGPRRAYDCGWLKCDQPYLSILTKGYITDIETSVREELDALLRVVYNYEG